MVADEDRYGFDIVRSLGAVDGMVVAEGTLYPLLSRLQKAGYVRAAWRESESGPPRKYYGITREGRRALADFAAEWRRFSAAVESMLPKGSPG